MYSKTFDELISKTDKTSKVKTVVVVAADDRHALEAVFKAEKKGILNPILIGDSSKIKKILFELGEGNKQIIGVFEPSDAAIIAVNMVNAGSADFIMKGKIETRDLLKEVVNKEYGIGKGRIMSHVAIHELPWYHKLLITTDGGMSMYPTIKEKIDIIQNAVDVLISLGYEKPKVAVLAAIESVNYKMTETLEAAELKKVYSTSEFKNIVVEGPISFDLAVNKEKALIKEYESPVAGDADILLVPNITVGNILGKSFLEFAGVKMAGLILGAKVPIVLTSRGASEEEKYLSLLVAALIS